MEIFTSIVEMNDDDILQLILNNWDTRLTCLIKYFRSVFADITLVDSSNVATNKTLMMKHFEHNLQAFWIFIEYEYLVIEDDTPHLSARELQFAGCIAKDEMCTGNADKIQGAETIDRRTLHKTMRINLKALIDN
ncbi:hypothetical protein RF11_08299 [Thelohanellus kitauei]|uniref:Uncharacterized protein n=1 Tax=Thelohanellus kitauei TaxID=669202 RepID=A0A0C2ME61_THEKT|nr:hypothetical protein RF11_08299 [Thelohanellus kitauei]